MSKQDRKREPLFYITQPQVNIPTGKMQETYSAKKAEKERAERERKLKEQAVVHEDKVKKKKQKFFIEDLGEETGAFSGKKKPLADEPAADEIQEVINQYEETETPNETVNYGLRRVKSFKEMSLSERIDYLVHFPKQLPPVPCAFSTDEEIYKGFLVTRGEDDVEIKLYNQKKIVVKLSDLKEIRMIGF
jgi:hypothetical protein